MVDGDGSSQLVVFEIGTRHYALPLDQVEEVLRMVAVTPVPEAPAWVAGVVNVRGRLMPMIDLRPRAGLPPGEPDPTAVFIVASSGGRTLAVRADSVVDVVTVPSAAVERPDEVTASHGLVTGITRSGHGIVLIVDLERLSPGADVMLVPG